MVYVNLPRRYGEKRGEERMEFYIAPIFEKLSRSRCLQRRWRKIIQSAERKAGKVVSWN